MAIVPTARAISRAELQAGMELARGWGLNVKLGMGVGRKHFQQAGTMAERAADLCEAVADPKVKAIWCARGGYGTVHLLGHVDLAQLRAHPKWIVGFSDVTVLHSALNHVGVASLHAQMPFNVQGKTAACTGSLQQALFGQWPMELATPVPHPLNRQGTAVGELVGGNLSILYSMRGTPYDLDPRGKILFLEDLDELLYHVDRMVMNLKLGGWFDQLAGLVVGGMSDMHDKNPDDPFGQSAEEILDRALGDAPFPVCFGFPAGHMADNRCLAMGTKAKLSVTLAGAALSFDGVAADAAG